MGRASGPEPEARLREGRVPLRLQHLQHRLLDEAVEHRGHAERACAARGLRDLDPPHRLRPVGAVQKLVPDRGPVVLQVGRQIIDAHHVNAGRALVAPDLRQRLPQIVTRDNPLHGRSNRDRRAVGCSCRRAGFGPFGDGAWGFTPRLRPEGQLELVFPPPGPHEIAVLLAHSTVRAFGDRTTYYAVC